MVCQLFTLLTLFLRQWGGGLLEDVLWFHLLCVRSFKSVLHLVPQLPFIQSFFLVSFSCLIPLASKTSVQDSHVRVCV